MNKNLLLVGVIVAAIAFIAGGVFLGQANAQDFQPGSMMGRPNGNAQAVQSGYGMMGGGMMDGQYGGMMNGFGSLANVDPLTTEEAKTAVSCGN